MDEKPIVEFLKQQKELDGAIESWSFASFPLNYLLKKIDPDQGPDTYFSDYSGHKNSKIYVYTIEDDFLDTADPKYYFLNEVD